MASVTYWRKPFVLAFNNVTYIMQLYKYQVFFTPYFFNTHELTSSLNVFLTVLYKTTSLHPTALSDKLYNIGISISLMACSSKPWSSNFSFLSFTCSFNSSSKVRQRENSKIGKNIKRGGHYLQQGLVPRFTPLIWKLGLDRASIVGKLKPTAAILEWPLEGVQWRHRKENENSGIFYLKLTNEMCWLDTN